MLTPDDLRAYQQRAITEAYERDHIILRIKMGGGKTVIMATAAWELLSDGEVNRVLVFAPARVAKKVWRDEFKEWSHLPEDRLGLATGDAEQRMSVIDDPLKRIVVLSFNNIPWFFNTYPDHDFDCLMVDELTKLKDRKGKWFRTLSKQARHFAPRIAGTGTLVSEGVDDLWSQAFIVDRGYCLGRTHGKFRREYFDYVGPNHWNWVPHDDAVERATEKMAPITFQIDGSEYEDQLPPLVSNVIKVDMSPQARMVYAELYNQAYHELNDGTEVEAVNAGVLTGKLQQIADGFLYKPSEDDRPPSDWEWLHNAKLDALEELIEIAAGEPMLVAYQYRAELAELLKRYPAPYLGSGVSDAEAEAAMDAWNRGELPVLYIHPQSAGHGLNLQHGGDTIVWYGLTWSLDEHDQLNARLRRSGQKSGNVWAHYLICEDTVEEDIQKALVDKRNVQEAVYAGLRGEPLTGP